MFHEIFIDDYISVTTEDNDIKTEDIWILFSSRSS
jgi:hypothetical protein